MDANAERLEFAPPREPAAVRAFTLAIIAHLLLMAALTWGVNWKKETENLSAEAELWAAVPKEAAPPPVPQMSPPPPAPKIETPPPPPVAVQPDITIERDKRNQELAQQRAEELELKKKLDAKKKRQELEREKKQEAKREQEELKKQRIAEEKATEEKQRKEDLAKAKKGEATLAKLRQENLARMMKGLEGTTGTTSSTGSSAKSAGPSPSWAGRVQRAVYPNIIFREQSGGALRVVVTIALAPDGTIIGKPIIKKSSGTPEWDDAVVRGLEKTGVLPRDVDGKVFSPAEIGFTREAR